jgi:hypothetical protein
MRRLGLALALLIAAAGAVQAQGDEGEGRRRWRHGQELYEQGRYLDAAHEFEAGYALAPRPLFFLSIGHAYRKAHELAKAKAAYEKLLTLQPDFPGRAEVEGYIKSIDDALQVAEPAARDSTPSPAAPVAPLVSPRPLPPTDLGSTSAPYPPSAPPVAAPAPAMVDTRATPEAPTSSSRPLLRRPWFWVVVGAVVAGGVATAIIAAHPSSSCPGTLCIRETP